ncbi:hypothetical protein V6R21_19050 [Limibacter armeniacum]|uniref:hypothetical protein n=1 Tax=Limibacter armeniacum TaxID=466084 RepID=UPI002FE64A98
MFKVDPATLSDDEWVTYIAKAEYIKELENGDQNGRTEGQVEGGVSGRGAGTGRRV